MKFIFFEVTLLTSYGGVQTCAWNLAREFYRLGHDVKVLTGAGPLACPYPELAACVHAFPYRPREQHIQFLGRRLPKILERRSLVQASGDFLKTEAPGADLIFFKPHDLLALGGRLRDFRHVCFHSQGTDFVPFDRRLFRHHVTHVSACSHFNAWQLQKHFKRVPQVVHNGVPTHFIEMSFNQQARERWRQKFGTASGTRVFAYAGRMVGWKGLNIFIEAMAQAGNPSARTEELWLIGNGASLQRWLDLAARLGLKERVKHHPAIPHSELPGFWDAADIGVFPSIGDEAFGISIAEAMTRRKPVIASYVGGISEVVGNEGQCGWLCNNSDVTAFVHAIDQSRQADLQAKGDNARKRAALHFQWPDLAGQLIKHISKKK
jgi:glycosyltransferase involved in cell wall biosynthesis